MLLKSPGGANRKERLVSTRVIESDYREEEERKELSEMTMRAGMTMMLTIVDAQPVESRCCRWANDAYTGTINIPW
jgi:hypothetical protein